MHLLVVDGDTKIKKSTVRSNSHIPIVVDLEMELFKQWKRDYILEIEGEL